MIGLRDPGSRIRLRWLFAAAAGLALFGAIPALAADTAPTGIPIDVTYQQALDQYEHGDYADAARNLRDVIENAPPGFDRDKLKRAWLYRGISLFITGDRAGAEKSFWQVLLLDPEFRPDPLFTLPAIIAAFDGVRSDHAEALRTVPRLFRRRDDTPRDSLGVPLKDDPNQRNFFDAISPVLPFGYAQYRNQQKGKALAVGLSEGALVLAITGTYVSFQTLRKPGDHFHPDEANVARIDKTLNNTAYVLLLGELVYGAIDGVYFNTAAPRKPSPHVTPGPGTVGLAISVPF